MNTKDIRIERQALEQFCEHVFQALGMSAEDSNTAAAAPQIASRQPSDGPASFKIAPTNNKAATNGNIPLWKAGF